MVRATLENQTSRFVRDKFYFRSGNAGKIEHENTATRLDLFLKNFRPESFLFIQPPCCYTTTVESGYEFKKRGPFNLERPLSLVVSLLNSRSFVSSKKEKRNLCFAFFDVQQLKTIRYFRPARENTNSRYENIGVERSFERPSIPIVRINKRASIEYLATFALFTSFHPPTHRPFIAGCEIYSAKIA